MATNGPMCNTSIFNYANQSNDITNISLHLNESLLGEEDSAKVLAVIYLVVFVVGLTGNSLAIFVVLRYTKMKTVTNMYILNLAVADELYILGLPFLTTHNVLTYWPFGNFLCRILMWADSISQFTSTFCLTVMSIDRYMAVVHPIRSARWRRPSVAKVINSMVWALACLLTLPVIIYCDVQPELNTCNLSWPEPRDVWSTAFILYTAILGFFCPLLVICLCYLLIVIKVKSAGARAGLSKRRASEKKVTRMVVIIVVVFVLCWLPFFMLNIINVIRTLPENGIITGVYFLTVILTYVNSCANPLLYGFLSDNFKRSFQKVLCIHRVNGISDGLPSRARLSRTHHNEPIFPPRSFDNDPVQSYQSIGLEAEPCAKTEIHRPGPQVISQSI
ncbi:somatostatin receptor type 5 [Ctenopharyngodon idella]|uniref:Somatostatin receptor 5 n=1 Tax=Ctenopharyngodon idella TaxID=7959 RepID=B2D1T7_CTEID|nr:somatostatin receptor type 5 [Ctenopharyngodon idella]XP_051742489.1 somatostatin receptor type 5 [Ctenopharyngodon idella]ACB69422.1 somatostatin receptor 5 [Ctenopharyngodon idella]